jgi:NADH-quinone oxidoreductase subunit N
LWLAIIGIVTSVISAFYYLRVVYLMFMFDGEVELDHKPALVAAVVITVAVTLLLGILPAWGFDFASNAVIQSAQAIIAGG